MIGIQSPRSWGQFHEFKRPLRTKLLVLPIAAWLLLSVEVRGSEDAGPGPFLPIESEIRACINAGEHCQRIGVLNQRTELLEEIDAGVYESRIDAPDAKADSVAPYMVQFDLAIPMQVTVSGQGYAYFSLFQFRGNSITPHFLHLEGVSFRLNAGRYVLLGYPDINALRGGGESLVMVIDPARPPEGGAAEAGETSKTLDRNQERQKLKRQFRFGAVLGILLTVLWVVYATR